MPSSFQLATFETNEAWTADAPTQIALTANTVVFPEGTQSLDMNPLVGGIPAGSEFCRSTTLPNAATDLSTIGTGFNGTELTSTKFAFSCWVRRSSASAVFSRISVIGTHAIGTFAWSGPYLGTLGHPTPFVQTIIQGLPVGGPGQRVIIPITRPNTTDTIALSFTEVVIANGTFSQAFANHTYTLGALITIDDLRLVRYSPPAPPGGTWAPTNKPTTSWTAVSDDASTWTKTGKA